MPREGRNGETVGFGSFKVRKKGQRIGRNPKTGTEVPIAPRRVMTFKASGILKRRIKRYSTGSASTDAVESLA